MTKEDILFSETRQYRRWWMWVVVILLNIPLIGLMLTHILRHGIPHHKYEVWMIVVAFTLFLISLLLIYIRMDTVVTSKGIFMRVMPFNMTFKHYYRYAIKSVSVVKCGRRGECDCEDMGGESSRTKGLASRFRMNIELNGGEVISIDTFKPKELRAALKEAGL